MALLRSLCLFSAALAASGCETPQRDPLPYSPNYTRLDAAAGGTRQGVVRKGYDATEGAAYAEGALVPDACITPDVAEQPMFLPPGCANNLNLQMMVERKSDLLHGRRSGPAMAAPVARAARKVIDGEPPRGNAQAPKELDTRSSAD